MNLKLKYIKILFACALIGLANGISAQKPDEHPKTAYTDSLGRLIVNMNMPLYIYVATSPDEAPRQLSRNDTKGKEKEPFYLDAPGVHLIRHQDNSAHRADSYPVWADGQAPRTTVSFEGAPVYVRDGMTYYGKNLTVTLSATDDLAGVKQIYYSTDQIKFVPYSHIDASKAGKHRLAYYSVDNVGNVETVAEKEFIIDLSTPVTLHQVSGIFKNEIISKTTQIHLTSTDSVTGVERTMYRFNNETEKLYRPGSKISFSHLPDGMHTLYYYSENRVKNKENEKSFSFYLDKIAPIISADVLGDKYIVGEKVYFSGKTKLKLTAVDNKSGIKELKYSINDEPFMDYVEPFYLPNKAGKHVVRYYVEDEVGNSSDGDYSHNAGTIYVDLVGPVLSHDISGPNFQKGDVKFISPQSKITLKASDAESGLQYITYSIDGQIDETRYKTPFTIKESGTHKIRYFGYDNVNNRNAREFEVTVDAEGPEIFNTFSIQRIDGENAGGAAEDADVYPSYVVLYLAATDMMTGNAEIYYSINGENEIPYTAPIKGFAKNVSYTVVVKAKDKLGNFSTKTIHFKTGDF